VSCVLYTVKLSEYYTIYFPGGNIYILGGHNIDYSKQNCICTCFLFGTVSKMELFRCTFAKLLLKCNYVLFLKSVFIVQVAMLVQFDQYNTFPKIPPSRLTHLETPVRIWRVVRLSAYCL